MKIFNQFIVGIIFLSSSHAFAERVPSEIAFLVCDHNAKLWRTIDPTQPNSIEELTYANSDSTGYVKSVDTSLLELQDQERGAQHPSSTYSPLNCDLNLPFP